MTKLKTSSSSLWIPRINIKIGFSPILSPQIGLQGCEDDGVDMELISGNGSAYGEYFLAVSLVRKMGMKRCSKVTVHQTSLSNMMRKLIFRVSPRQDLQAPLSGKDCSCSGCGLQGGKEEQITMQLLDAEIQAGIKWLEEVASGNISAEVHLLQEKKEYLKEIEVLHTQEDRNLERTLILTVCYCDLSVSLITVANS
ncbi:hypothetical protein C5167_015786 [Papaver somniferum]|uniref:Uncharacterized protein n=1 Tax=Papaver somniferum TaxID=3469 RepID=A0A4Y7JAX2_PAPSO|nr:hypothetical protein C5167_015786 [Papaver somniferum]